MGLLINIVDSSRAVIADGVWVAAQRSSVEYGGTSTVNATWVFLALILWMEYFTLNLNLFCWLEKKESKTTSSDQSFLSSRKVRTLQKYKKRNFGVKEILESF